MTFPQVNPGGWALNELLTSAQMNALQSQNVDSVDGVNGGTYALQSDLQFDGPGLFNVGTTMEFLSGSQLDMATGSSFNLVGGVMSLFSGTVSNFDGLIGVGATGEIEIETGGELKVESGGVLGIESGGLLNVELGGIIDVLLGGVITLNSGATIQVDTGSVEVQSGGDINVNSGGDLRVLSGGQLEVFSGGILDLNSGCVVNIADVDDVNVSGQSITMQWDGVPLLRTTNWDFLSTAGVFRQSDTSSGGTFILPIRVNSGDTITQVRVRLDGGAGAGHAGLPASLPTITFRRGDPETGNATTISGPLTDPSASQAAYDVPHDVTISGLSETSTGQRYFVDIDGESGANAIDDTLQICGVEITVTLNSLRASQEVY